MPTATTITVMETLDLLDGPFSGIRKGVSEGRYALWLGSAISRDRVIGLDGVLAKLIEFLRQHITADPACGHRAVLEKVIALAALTDEQKKLIDFAVPSVEWKCLDDMVRRLWNQYSTVLSEEVPDKDLDYLLWDGLDFRHTFASQNADAEHLAIGMLALEGVFTELATANWDGLLEAAMRELGYPDSLYRVTVTGEDLKGLAAAAVLYKFHGCALRAIEDEDAYRPLLVARSAQIIGWITNAKFAMVREQLKALVQRTRTLMIGMSAQDANIQELFGNRGWKWTNKPAPIVFSAQELNVGQKTILEVAYQGEYEPNRAAIIGEACLPAYSKALLLALLLSILTTKLQVMAGDVVAPRFRESLP
jgi:hypothetical protein